MKLSISPRAARDLEAIGDYIARDNPSRAVSFVREIREQFGRIARRPAAFPTRDDLAAGLRMAVHGNYLILFRVVDKTVRVERVIHGAATSEMPDATRKNKLIRKSTSMREVLPSFWVIPESA